MNVTINYYGQTRQISQLDSETFIVEDASKLSDVVEAVSAKYGDRMRILLINDDGSLKKSVLTPVNGDVLDDDGAAALLKEGDEISLFPALSGG